MMNASFDPMSVAQSVVGDPMLAAVLVRGCDGEMCAASLVDVDAIEEIAAHRLVGDGRNVWVHAGGGVVPVLGIAALDALRSKTHTVLFFRDGRRRVGLVVGRALDVVQGTVAADGMLCWRGLTLRRIDPDALFAAAYAGRDLSAHLNGRPGWGGRVRRLVSALFAHTPKRRVA